MISANDPVTACFRFAAGQGQSDVREFGGARHDPLAAARGWRDHVGQMTTGGGSPMSSMSEDADPSENRAVARNAAAGPLPSRVTFNRLELNRILNLYGRMVADGEWRDYAIDFLKDRAVFSVFRRASEVPIYRIEKDPRLARKQGIYSVISATGLILRRGHELDRVLLVIDRKLAVV
jgi:hypothetical protein